MRLALEQSSHVLLRLYEQAAIRPALPHWFVEAVDSLGTESTVVPHR
jgi:hypothetical protein